MVKIGKTVYNIDSTKSEDGMNVFQLSIKNTKKTLIYSFRLSMYTLYSGRCGYPKIVTPEFV